MEVRVCAHLLGLHRVVDCPPEPVGRRVREDRAGDARGAADGHAASHRRQVAANRLDCERKGVYFKFRLLKAEV